MKSKTVMSAQVIHEFVGSANARLFRWLGCILVGCCILSFSQAATISVGSTNISSGTAFTLPVTVDVGTNAFGCYLFGLNYDPSVLQVTAVTAAETFPNNVFLYNTNFHGYLVALGENLLSLTSPTGSMVVAYLSFLAIGAPGTTTTLELAPGPVSPLEVCNTDGVDLPVSAVNGIVNVGFPTVDQLVPCAGPVSGGNWKNHGQYVVAVREVAEMFLAEGVFSEPEAKAIITRAAQSDCGSHGK